MDKTGIREDVPLLNPQLGKSRRGEDSNPCLWGHQPCAVLSLPQSGETTGAFGLSLYFILCHCSLYVYLMTFSPHLCIKSSKAPYKYQNTLSVLFAPEGHIKVFDGSVVPERVQWMIVHELVHILGKRELNVPCVFLPDERYCECVHSAVYERHSLTV